MSACRRRSRSSGSPAIQAIRTTKANFVITLLDVPGNVKLRKEAAAKERRA